MKIQLSIVLLVALAFLCTPGATAAPVGTLDVASCVGGGVTISAVTIDFTPPPGGGAGCIQTGSTTAVTYTGAPGALGPGVPGTIQDLVLGGGVVLDFMIFTGHPNLQFDLSGLGPGVANTACAATFTNPALPACSVAAGNPFLLAPNGNGTTITLPANGIARDASGIISTWAGAYTTQFAGLTPQQIQNVILSGGSVSNVYFGTFAVTTTNVPEPTSMRLLGGGLIGLGLAVRRRQKKA